MTRRLARILPLAIVLSTVTACAPADDDPAWDLEDNSSSGVEDAYSTQNNTSDDTGTGDQTTVAEPSDSGSPDTRPSDTGIADTAVDSSPAAPDISTDVAGRDTARTADTSSQRDTGRPTPDAGPPKPPVVNLDGRWLSDGYSCRGSHLEPIEITQSNQQLTATKLAGDDCVGTNIPTFKTQLNGPVRVGDDIPIQLAFGGIHRTTTPTYSSSTLKVVSKDKLTMERGGITLKRSPAAQPTSPPTQTWTAESYKCRGNYLYSTMKTTMQNGDLVGTVTNGQNCLVSWRGTPNGTSFSVQITIKTATGTNKQIPGTAELVTQDFILVEPTHQFWSIRMQTKQYF